MYGRMSWWKSLALFAGLVGFSQIGQAVDPRGIQIGKEWSVVGVIADGETNGIAVIKDKSKTYTVKIGDLLPGNPDFSVKAVRRKQVILTDGSDEVAIKYQAPSRDAWGEEEPVSRFAESYFTGFSTVPLDYYKKRKDAGVDADGSLQDIPFMMKKVADPAEKGGEYELFRREKSYGKTFKDRSGVEEDADDSDVYVHYDNFSDEEFSDEEQPKKQKATWETIPRRALDDSYSDNDAEEEAGWEDENVEEIDEEWEEPTDW